MGLISEIRAAWRARTEPPGMDPRIPWAAVCEVCTHEEFVPGCTCEKPACLCHRYRKVETVYCTTCFYDPLADDSDLYEQRDRSYGTYPYWLAHCTDLHALDHGAHEPEWFAEGYRT